MKSIAVYCGSSMGNDAVFKTTAYQLGEELANRNIQLVYGGATVGLMGTVADGALSKGGKVIGVLTDFLKNKELAHEGLTDLFFVETMHERKLKMYELSEGIIALPGGYGTLDELFEMLTWAQLGLHKYPVGLLNVDGYFDHLLAFVQTMVDKGFLKEVNQHMLLVSDTIEGLLKKMQEYQPPIVGKWITPENV